MLETSDSVKTANQLRIERRAGHDIRWVMTSAWEASDGTLQGAAAWITEEYGVPVSFGVLSDWIDRFDGVIRKTLEFPQ